MPVAPKFLISVDRMRLAAGLFCSLPLFAAIATAADVPVINQQLTATPADTPQVHAAEGFTVELVAGPPLVDRPITAAFDEQGRLYVADSSGSNDPVEKQLEEKPHRIVRLADTDGDGRFDKRVVFADKMMFPEGTMWLDGSLYVSAPPSIWKLTDTDGDGVADQREEWFEGKTLTGCANDLHGPYLGPDGWIYWCKGAFAEQISPGERPRIPQPRRPHLPLPARRHRHRAGDDRRHGQPRRRRVHAQRRTDLLIDIPRTPATAAATV